MATLSRDEYRDKVYACWLGKNCGGTLGAPLERMFGEAEPFAIDWYPELREGGIPNDDLELQLIWLKAVEERGFDVGARELAQYWLDYVGYNWDEYGMHKTNLRLGLAPPVSGYYNNWFRDCMGSPIRSEIWACLAPGAPEIAARYAYEDAIVDHAGGESVWGEIFNATVQSAAFVERDPQALLEIGLSYIPADSLTASAVQAARAAHRDGVDWKEARARVLQAAPHYNSQFSPPNIGFQTIGWLYGADFGDALCTAVNCGYDTDCTGATLGALLGILGGRAALPDRWTAPLGDTITTNESWGGLRNTATGTNPVPTTLDGLTDRICALGPRLLALRGSPIAIGDRTDLRDLDARSLRPQGDLAYAGASPLILNTRLGALDLSLDYLDTPAVAPGLPKELAVRLHNPHLDDIPLEVGLSAPAGWRVEPEGMRPIQVPAGDTITLHYTVAVDDPAHLHNSNRALLLATPQGRPAEPSLPVVLVGARRWLLWGPAPFGESSAAEALGREFLPERVPVAGVEWGAVPDGWRIAHAPDNALPLPERWDGVLYARLYLWSESAREVRLGVPATSPRVLWLNGAALHTVPEATLLRPNYNGDHRSYVDARLEGGWNEVLIKYTRDADASPFAAHFILATTGLNHGIHDVEWTAFPWDGRHE